MIDQHTIDALNSAFNGQKPVECGSDIRGGLHTAPRIDPPQHGV